MTPKTVRAVTTPPEHHFFGYYEKSPWDGSGRYLLAHGVGFNDRFPDVDDEAAIQLIDTEAGDSAETLATTTAWNFQQGSMLQWRGPGYSDEIVFNDRAGESFITRVLDVETGEERSLPMPIYATSPDGTTAFTLDFARLRRPRSTCGYTYALDGTPDEPLAPAPDDTGVRRLDLETGRTELLVSLSDLVEFKPVSSMDEGPHWVNHIQVSPRGKRVGFLHRWDDGEGERHHRLFTMCSDGSELELVVEGLVSHYDWRSESELVAWSREEDEAFHHYDLKTGAVEPFAAGILDEDGHLSFSPDSRWVLVDTYPDADREQHLRLYEPGESRVVDIGSFYSIPMPSRPLRCDLHPRWNRTGTAVCFDSTHEGSRQLYVADVSAHTSA